MSSFFPYLSSVPSNMYSLVDSSPLPSVVAYDGSVVGWRFGLCLDCESLARDYCNDMKQGLQSLDIDIDRHDLSSSYFYDLGVHCRAANHTPNNLYSLIHTHNTYYTRGYEYNLTLKWRQHSYFRHLYYKKCSF